MTRDTLEGPTVAPTQSRYRYAMRKSPLLTVAVAVALLMLGIGSGSALGDGIEYKQIPGQLASVGANPHSLVVKYSPSVPYTSTTFPFSDCGNVVGVQPSVTETATSVTVTLTAEVTEEMNGICALPGLTSTVAIPLPGPLAGRTINGLHVEGGAYGQSQPSSGPLPSGSSPSTPSLVGLSPRDARLLLSNPGKPRVELVIHRTHRRSGNLPTVVAQRPAAGKPMRHGTLVVLTVKR
jgi:hypothetical protein